MVERMRLPQPSLRLVRVHYHIVTIVYSAPSQLPTLYGFLFGLGMFTAVVISAFGAWWP